MNIRYTRRELWWVAPFYRHARFPCNRWFRRFLLSRRFRFVAWLIGGVGVLAVLMARDFAVLPIGALEEARGQIAGVAWRVKPDSSWVLVDKHGNIPFTAEEDSILRTFLDVEFIGEDSIQVWLEQNGWNAP